MGEKWGKKNLREEIRSFQCLRVLACSGLCSPNQAGKHNQDSGGTLPPFKLLRILFLPCLHCLKRRDYSVSKCKLMQMIGMKLDQQFFIFIFFIFSCIQQFFTFVSTKPSASILAEIIHGSSHLGKPVSHCQPTRKTTAFSSG